MNLPRPMRMPKFMLDDRRQADLYARYGSAFGHLPRLDQLGPDPDVYSLPSDHHPKPSTDSSLTAFAQLACMRLRGTRALISLVDDNSQHVLAEATPDLNLRAGSHDSTANSLWLGSVSVPRKWGLCEQVIEIDPQTVQNTGNTVVIVNNLAESPRYCRRTYVTGSPHVCFYAGVALVSPKGAIVGTLCVFDDKPREGLPDAEFHHLQDLAATIMEYLDSYTIKERFKRGEQLTRALISFAEGHSTLQSVSDGSSVKALPESSSPLLPSSANTEHEIASRIGSSHPSSCRDPGSITSATSTLPQSVAPSVHQSSNFASVKALQDSILPFNSRLMFARAARLIQASSNLDGVLLLDASVAGVGKSNHAGNSETDNLSQQESSDGSFGSTASSSDESDLQNARRVPQGTGSNHPRKTCQILGFATPERSDFGGDKATASYRSLHETDLTRLLSIYPGGKVLNFTSAGENLSTDESDDSAASTKHDVASSEKPPNPPKRKYAGTQVDRLSSALRELLPDARSVAFVPFWDYERSRWFAGCLCWSNSPERQLSDRLDLAYFKVFSHSIMTELSRLDALASSQAKTSFVASISHELRSPLHGILGTLEFFKETHLDSFQLSMLSSLAACGQTLLDTINHVLDYSKAGESVKGFSSKRLTGPKTIRVSSKLLKNRRSSATLQDSGFDLAIATEEVVEACFSGTSYTFLGNEDLDAAFSGSGQTSLGQHSVQQSSRRQNRFLILDIACEADWNYCVPPGSWRRVLMNILGNSLKYTDSGHVRISLRAGAPVDSKGTWRAVKLRVSDSGRGMDTHFLANSAFQPFSQENPHSTGTGLGLSIVRQIIEDIGGKIEITSDPSVGTDVLVKFLLPQWKELPTDNAQRNAFNEILPELENRRVSILHKTALSLPQKNAIPDGGESLTRFGDSVAATLGTHLKMEVNQTTDWSHDADFVICPEVSFDYLYEIRRRRTVGTRAPVTIFVATDAIEAAALRNDARVTSKESVVEIMTQPCGPMKLAVILKNCVKRFESPDENTWSPLAATRSPLRGVQRPSPIPMLKPHLSDAESEYQSAASIHSVTESRDLQDVSTAESPLLETRTLSRQTSGVSPKSMDLEVVPARASSDMTTSSAVKDLESSKTESSTPKFPASALPSIQSDRVKSHPSSSVYEKATVKRVLITDDNAINRKLLVAFLKRLHIRYDEAQNGLEALLSYQEATEKFDVILMDISMPVMDGMAATRAIREYEAKNNVPRAHIIALTGLASASARLEAWSSGIDQYITKPVNFKMLEQHLKDEELRKAARKMTSEELEKSEERDTHQDDKVVENLSVSLEEEGPEKPSV